MASKRDQPPITLPQVTIAELTAHVADPKARRKKAHRDAAKREAVPTSKLDQFAGREVRWVERGDAASRQGARRGRTAEAKVEATKAKRRANDEKKAPLVTDKVPRLVPADQRACTSRATTELTATAPIERVAWGHFPGSLRRRAHGSEVLECARCATQVTSQALPRPFETRPCDADRLFHVIVQKCACSVTINRLEKQFQPLGISVSPCTTIDLSRAAAEHLSPLHLRLLQPAASADLVFSNETTLATQTRKKRR